MPVTVPDRFHNVTLGGNTAGVLAEISSGTLTIAGGNNITLSQAGNAITISGAAAGGAAFSGGDSNIGNTSGDTGVVTGRMVLAGGNNITLSGSTDAGSITITISGANIGGAQTGISGIANSETTYTSGSVTLSALGAITIRSTTGQHFQFSVAPQSQESNTIGMSNIGNTAGDTAIRSAAQLRIVLAGGNNITLSQSTNGSSATITISAFNQTSPVVGADIASVSSATNSGTATSQFAAEDHVHAGVGPLGVSNIGNTAGDTGTQYGRVVLAGGNNITLSVSSSNNGAQTITVSAFNQTQESNTIGMSNIGNTAGDTAIRSAAQLRIVLAGGNNITLSQSTNGSSATITISAFNQTSQSNTIGMSNIGNTAGDTAIRSGPNLQIVFAGGNNITLSQSTNGSSATITVSAFNQTQESNTIGMSNIGNTAGDTAIRSAAQLRIVLAGGNNITLSQSTNGSSATITISAFNQTSPVVGNAIQSVSSATDSGAATSRFAAEDHKHAGVGPFGVSNIGNTSGDTGTQYGRVVLAGGNNVTLSVSSSNNGAQTITISAAAGGGANYSAGLSNIGNTAGDTGLASQRLVLAGGNNVTLSGSTDGGSMTITVSAFNQTQESNTIGMSNIGNTAGDTAIRSAAQLRIVLAGGNNITLSQSTNGSSATITISAFNQTVENNTIGMSNIGNTSGDTAIRSGAQLRIVFAGGNNITLSQSTDGSSATITISGAAGGGAGYTAGLSNIGNTSGDTGVVTGRLVFAGGNNITLSGSTDGGSMTITVSNQPPALPWYEWPEGGGRHQVQSLGNASLVVYPFYVHRPITAHSVFWAMNITGASNSTAGMTVPIGIYTQMTGASSSRISLLASAQFTSSWTSNSVANGDWLGIFGIRRWATAMDLTLTPGWYWAGIGYRSTNAGTYSFMVHGSNIMSGIGGASNATRQFLPFMGAFNTTTLTAPNSIGSSAIPAGGNARAFPWIAFGNTDSLNFGA